MALAVGEEREGVIASQRGAEVFDVVELLAVLDVHRGAPQQVARVVPHLVSGSDAGFSVSNNHASPGDARYQMQFIARVLTYRASWGG